MTALADIATVAGRLRAPLCRSGQPLELEMRYSAEIDGDRRWSLHRFWSREGAPQLILPWIMLNPSTADGRTNDPTLWRIIRWSWRWGFDGLLVVNLFPYRSPSPADLRKWLRWDERQDWHVRDDICTNQERVGQLLRPFDAAMAAWGAQAGTLGDEVDFAAERVLDAINEARSERVLKLFCIGETAGGLPKHPMARGVHRVPDDAAPMPLSNYPGTIVGLEKDIAYG